MDQTNTPPSGGNDLPYRADGSPAFEAMTPAQLTQAQTLLASGRLTMRPPAPPQPNQYTPQATPLRPKDLDANPLGLSIRVNDKSHKREVRVGGPTGYGVLGSAVDAGHRMSVTVDANTDPSKVIVSVPMGGREVEMRLSQAIELGAVSRDESGRYVDHTDLAATQRANERPARMTFSPVVRQAAARLGDLTRQAGMLNTSQHLVAAVTNGDGVSYRRIVGELSGKTRVPAETINALVQKIGSEVATVVRGQAAVQGLDSEAAWAEVRKHDRFPQAVREAVNGGSTEGLLFILDDIKRSGRTVLNTGLPGRMNPDGSVSVGGLGVTTSAGLARRLGATLPEYGRRR